MKKFKVLVVLLILRGVELKFFGRGDETISRNLIAYDSAQVRMNHDASHDLQQETFYYVPHVERDPNNITETVNIQKRGTDATFRGKPRTTSELWARNFNISSHVYSQSTSLVNLMSKIIIRYLGQCIPIVLYDAYVEKSEGFVLQRLFQEFPTSFAHGSIGVNFTLKDSSLLFTSDARCRSYILFVSDALKTRQVLGPQIDSKVIVVPRSTQWKLQEFLMSPLSRDIINLLVIGESYTADRTKERPYVLYTHQLYVDGLGSNKPKVLTSWMNGKLSRPHIDLFPTKLKKGFAGHRFTIAAADFPPFVFKRLSTDGMGNVHIKWDGFELRMLQVLGRRLNFTFDVVEPKSLTTLGSGDAIAEAVVKRQSDIGIAGMYVTKERNSGMEMSVSHGTDCAAFVTLTSKALPRYRAILGPFQWQVWLCLTLTYLVAIIPLAYSDSLSIRYLIEKPGQIENMFWYVFGTFTNSLTFSGEMSWSNSRKTSTRILIGFYWVFTIIITACYTGSIIAFVTIPVFPETLDTLDQLAGGFYRVGTLDKGGWERWFLNSSDKTTSKLFKGLELVRDLEEGLGNVTKPYFLFPYAFIGSKAQLEYVIQTNFSDEKLGKRSALHISDQCFALFGVSFAFVQDSVYRQKINDGILMLQQSGFIQKIKNDVRWDMMRSSTGALLQITTGKTLKLSTQLERGLTLADTEGMFLLLGIGFLIAGGVLISEWVGGCTNKCMRIMKVEREKKQKEHRMEEERKDDELREDERKEEERIEDERREDEHIRFDASELARQAVESPSPPLMLQIEDKSQNEPIYGSTSSRASRHSRSSSVQINDLNNAMLTEMFQGPQNRASNIVMIDGKMMSEHEATLYASDARESSDKKPRGSYGNESEISKSFSFLNQESDDDDGDNSRKPESLSQVCHVEINLQVPSPRVGADIEDCFGEKVSH